MKNMFLFPILLSSRREIKIYGNRKSGFLGEFI